MTGRVLAAGREHVAIETSGNSFSILERAALDRTPAVGEEIRVKLRDGRAAVESASRGREPEHGR